jgi:hypothetical protein
MLYFRIVLFVPEPPHRTHEVHAMNTIRALANVVLGLMLTLFCAGALWVVLMNGPITHVTPLSQPPQADECADRMQEITKISCGMWEVFAIYETGQNTFEAACLRRELGLATLDAERTGAYAAVDFAGSEPLLYCRGEGTNPPTQPAPATYTGERNFTRSVRHPNGAGHTEISATYSYGCPGGDRTFRQTAER